MVKKRDIPKVLEQRLSITPHERTILKTIEEMSPRDTSFLYIPGNPLNSPVPSLEILSNKLGKSTKLVSKDLESIRKKWKLPTKDNLPTNNGIYDKDHALIHALGNQHKLRFDENLGDYRVPKVHVFNALMSTGTLIANNDAFEGEKIVRQAMGLDEILNSYNVQDGIIPEIIEIYGKSKHQRALMTGLNKTGNIISEKEREAVKRTLAIEGNEVTDKDLKNMDKYIFGTINSFEEAAKSVAHELAPMYKNIPEHVDIHWHYGASDFANMKELESVQVAKRRTTNRKMKAANESLPKWRDEIDEIRQKNAKTLVNKLLSDKAYLHINAQRKKFDEENPFPEKGEEFQNIIDSYFVTVRGNPAKRVEQLKNSIKKNYSETLGKAGEMFDSIFDTAVIEYRDINNFKQMKDFKDKETAELEKTSRKISTLDDKISEAESFENALTREETQGPSWFTGHIAIKPTDAKVMQKINKQNYKDLYEKITIPELKRLTGKNHRIHLHTDKLITTHIPDPEHQINWDNMTEEERAATPIGTTITTFPQTNVERSNEPVKTGFGELQSFQQAVLSDRVNKRKVRPKTHGEFKKNEHGSSDIYTTGHGAEGALVQTKFTVAPTRVKGEYETEKELTTFIKVPTRHDYGKLYDLMAKGNTGTWYAKRAEKGGDTPGNIIMIQHPDQSTEEIFINDSEYARVGREYGERVKELEKTIGKLEEKVSRKGTLKYKKDHKIKLDNAKSELSSIYEEVRPSPYKVFNANDLHFGEWSMPGRYSLKEGIRASQLAALQSVGFQDIKYGIITESFNGAQAFRSYDAKLLGPWESGAKFMNNLNVLTERLMNKGYSMQDIIKHKDIFIEESIDGIVDFKKEAQIDDFKLYEQSMFHELMNHGAVIHAGMGNHWQASGREQQSESHVVVNALDSDGFYQSQGMIESGYGSTSGQGFNYDMARIPSADDKGLAAVVAHKAWSGKTEINGPIPQMIRTKDNAHYGFFADRHHSGMAIQGGKTIFLDIGKPPVNPFVQMIGKCSSTRGTQIPSYDPTGNNGYSSIREFSDKVVEKIIGWDEKAGVLERCHSLIQEGMKDAGLMKKMAQINKLNTNYLTNKK